jgi:hypothetical protein
MAWAEVEDGVRLFYEDLGTGRPLVLLHGWTMTHQVSTTRFRTSPATIGWCCRISAATVTPTSRSVATTPIGTRPMSAR